MGIMKIYTDGGCRNNPGIGAWAFAIFDESNKLISKGTDFSNYTTNNEMELTAILNALNSISSGDYIICSDSSYCINSITLWSDNWIKDGSIRNRPNGTLILQIKNRLLKLKSTCNIVFLKVKGHSGIPGNEFVDQLLNQTMDRHGHVTRVIDSPEVISGNFEIHGNFLVLNIDNKLVRFELTENQVSLINGD